MKLSVQFHTLTFQQLLLSMSGVCHGRQHEKAARRGKKNLSKTPTVCTRTQNKKIFAIVLGVVNPHKSVVTLQSHGLTNRVT
jgi:hypothetical protein